MFDKRPYLHLHFLVFLWGFTAILGLLIHLSFPEVVFYRTLFSFIAFIPVLYIAKIPFSIDPRTLFKLLITGLVISFHWLLFFGAARYANASVSLIGLSTTSLWTALIEPLARRQRMSKLEVFFGLLIILGLYIIYKDDFTYGVGLLMSLGSAFFAAVFSVTNSLFVRRLNPLQITFYETGGAFLGTIPFVVWQLNTEGRGLAFPTDMDLVYLLILALICTVYANAVWVRLLKSITAFAANLVINLEPIYGILLALLIFGQSESMNPGFYVGGGIIILTVFIYPVVSRRFRGGLS
ncbi:MAG: DMT family transporter [Cyclobacteriaceae bacterium]|nr:DMT family transporter [Cyclobacteriaceae bacterium]